MTRIGNATWEKVAWNDFGYYIEHYKKGVFESWALFGPEEREAYDAMTGKRVPNPVTIARFSRLEDAKFCMDAYFYAAKAKKQKEVA